ncbi:MAG: hypothetical protein LBJ67_15820 [Planctomycetaceae bacterium]|nr:hypothetical protein [Planctomycetaceae bacterium]
MPYIDLQFGVPNVKSMLYSSYFKFPEANMQSQQRETIAHGRILPPIPATVLLLFRYQ